MAPAIQTLGLTRSFAGERALDGLTIEVEPGEVLALLGPNGAGKTTTVRLLNGVLRPDSGEVHVLGFDPLTEGDELRRRTGVLTENAGLDDRLTALENLDLIGRLRGLSRAESTRRSHELLERFGMADRARVQVQGFSTGQRKRLALARAMLHDPDVLFLDEPTSGLDPSATRDVVDLIGSLAAEHGRTVILCTHFLGEAGRLAHRMAVLHRGRLQAFGRPDELAAELWDGLDVDIDLGSPADAGVLAAVRSVPGVSAAAIAPSGAVVGVRDRAVVPLLVAALVSREVQVFGATPRPRTLEDIYFEIEARTAAREQNPSAEVAA